MCMYTVFHVHTKLLLHSIYSKWLNKLFGETKDPDTNVLFCKLNNWRSTTLFPSQITCLWPPPKNTDPICRDTGRHASEKAYGHGGSWLDVSCGRTSHPLGVCCFDKCGWWKFFRSSIAFLSSHFWHFCCSPHQKGGLANNHLSLFWFTSNHCLRARFLEYLFVAGRQQKERFSPIWSSILHLILEFSKQFHPFMAQTTWGKVLGLSQILCMALVSHAFAMDPWHFFLGLGCFRYWKFVPTAAGG